jgi:hypothetical protein
MPHTTLCWYTIAEMTTGVLSHYSLHQHGTVLGTVRCVTVVGSSHRCLYLEYLPSSSSVCLQDHHVISLILLLRIRLTRRGGICWSEPRGVPRPAYDGGEYASPSLEASQDWHQAVESMPDEGSVPEKINLVQNRAKSAYYEDNPAWARGAPSWPSRNNTIRPSRVLLWEKPTGARRMKEARSGQAAQPGGGVPAQPGWLVGRKPSRGSGLPAQPENWRKAQPGREPGGPAGGRRAAHAGERAQPGQSANRARPERWAAGPTV